ncbi:hypothetical protein DL767_005494 [Monosporascus sp. MG133]|nr:hypothetical protein DL767_005494 [Monosporascus sp. MG133]
MRLACLTEDGDYVDISSAIVREPLVVRALLTDALFQCQAQLPDSLDYLRTEQAIRDCLQQFQGDQERYVRSYVLSRTLDHRIQQTPRADIIYQSFHYGGPLALVGVFYATLDAHRNPRNRETLDFFLHKASSESKLELIKRTSTFPCNSSVASWLQRILEKLEPDSQTLAYILRGLGLDRNVAELLLQRPDETVWTAEAAKIVIHAFPKHSNIEPAEYHLLPQILNPRVMALFDSAYLIQLSEVGLSASNFGERLWKNMAVTIATEAASILGADSADRALLLALANIRKASLALLYEAPGEWQAKSISFPIYDDRLALANAYLMKCMQVFQGQGQGLDWRSLQASRDIYQDLRAHPFPATYFGKIDHLSVLMGLAIADHLNGQVDNALRAWQAALAASQALLLTGYTDMIQAYSTSELQIRRGAGTQADVLGNYAKALFARTGRQYHFTGIGSFWPDILNIWYAASGRQPVIPPRRGE